MYQSIDPKHPSFYMIGQVLADLLERIFKRFSISKIKNENSIASIPLDCSDLYLLSVGSLLTLGFSRLYWSN